MVLSQLWIDPPFCNDYCHNNIYNNCGGCAHNVQDMMNRN